jgi:peptidoglycan/xylan/chitin deacetylase (PgdA/CDA1 family)
MDMNHKRLNPLQTNRTVCRSMWLVVSYLIIMGIIPSGSTSSDLQRLGMLEAPLVEAAQKKKTVQSKVSAQPKTLALTFDDGPDPVTTPKILQLLRQKKAKATFFVTGHQVAKYPHLAKQIVNEGHLIGNHTWSHRRFGQLNALQIRHELKQTNRLIESVTGTSTGWFRPPYGEINSAQKRWLKRSGYHTVMWNVDTRDWSGISADRICNIVRRQAKPGGIILMHTLQGNGKKKYHTVEAAGRIIDAYRKRGYQFITVDQTFKNRSR